MKNLLPGQTATVHYKDPHFDQIIGHLRQEVISPYATLLALTGMPKLHLELAAKEIAARLGKTLYRVDLHAASSKYMGEAEKNLRSLFGLAASAGSILFFDEADALFGRRTEVKDAHDRGANQKANYLTELLSKHRGLVIGLFRSTGEAELKKYQARLVLVKFPPL